MRYVTLTNVHVFVLEITKAEIIFLKTNLGWVLNSDASTTTMAQNCIIWDHK